MSHIAARPPLPYTVIVPTAYGQMILNRNDINQTNMLFKSGIAVDHKEIMLLANIFRLLGPGLTFLANQRVWLPRASRRREPAVCSGRTDGFDQD